MKIKYQTEKLLSIYLDKRSTFFIYFHFKSDFCPLFNHTFLKLSQKYKIKFYS